MKMEKEEMKKKINKVKKKKQRRETEIKAPSAAISVGEREMGRKKNGKKMREEEKL